MRRRIVKKAAKELLHATEGVFSTAIDASLWLVVYLTEATLFRRDGRMDVMQAFSDAEDFLEGFNYKTITHAFTEARRRGLIVSGTKGRRAWPEITKEGKRRLASIVPTYDEQRVWDGRPYLVTYDVPESLHYKRDMLRDAMRRLGCGKIQDSVYITPYNPRGALMDVIANIGLSGTIIIADIGKDGSIGDENLQALIARVYSLSTLTDRYEAWLESVDEDALKAIDVVRYLSILKDDPQLPFELLPPWWKGDAAYAVVKGYLGNSGNSSTAVDK